MTNSIDPVKTGRKGLKWSLMIATMVYCIIFPFLFYASLFAVGYLDCPFPRIILRGIIVFLCVAIPLSIPIFTYLMWRSYGRGEYEKAELFCIAPILTGIILSFLIDQIPL